VGAGPQSDLTVVTGKGFLLSPDQDSLLAPLLCTPLQLRDVTLRNRIIVSPMC
jgi:hypothetical protein